MAELQYRPSAAARALSNRRTKTIGVLAAGRAHYGPALSIQAIEEAARERGFSVTSSSVAGPDERSLRAAVANLIDQDIEALVVIAPAAAGLRDGRQPRPLHPLHHDAGRGHR